MHSDKSLISVIIPVYNGKTYLSQAIESVLYQTYRPLDIIVIDDGSTDGSSNIAKSYLPKLRYLFQTNSGISKALNSGIEMAQGSYLAFLDADDLWLQHKLVRQMETFVHNPSTEAVFTHIEQFHSPELESVVSQKYQYTQQIMQGYCADTLLVKKQAFDRVGYFDISFKAVGFMDWYARAREQKLRIEMIPEILAKRRIHTANMTIKKKDMVHKEYTRMLKAAISRRRPAQQSGRK